MSWLEITGALFSGICVWLAVIRNIWAWPTAIIASVLTFILFYQSKLYADMGLQVVFLVQSVYGWYFWLFGKKEDTEQVPIRVLSFSERGLVLLSSLGLIGVVGWLSATYTDTDVAYLDALVASVSLIANFLLARKILDNWIMWIFVDVIYVGLFYYKELYIYMVLYLAFLFMASSGFIQWRKQWRLQAAS